MSPIRTSRRNKMPVTGRMLGIVALATFASPVLGADDFPLVGTYTENQVCKADSSDSGVSQVQITIDDIDSGFGLCTILSRKRESPPSHCKSNAKARAAAE